MTEKYITYKHNGEYYDIPESLSAGYEEKFPDATIEMHDGEDVYDIPIQHKSGFLNKFPNATYAFDEQEEEKPSFWQKLGKHLTAAQDDSLGFVSGVDVTQEEEAPKVDNELADAVIKSNEKNKKEIDKTIEETDKAYYENKANEPKKSFWQKLAELPLRAQENEMIGDDAFSLEMKQENREKGKNYTDALIAKNITEKTDKKIEQYEDPAKTFVGGVLQGAKDSIFDLDTWDQSIGLEESARVLEISKKLEKGQSLTKGEQMIIDALVNDLASDVSMAAGFGRGYKAGKVTGESLPFMVETFLNPASGLGEAITKKFGKQILKKVSNKALGKAALYAARVGADVTGAALMSATTSQARVSADAMDRLTGEVDFNIDEDGGLTFNGFVGGEDSALKAYGKAFGSDTIDHFSEMVGNYFGPLGHRAGRWSKKQLAKAADAFGMKKIANNLRTMTPNGFGAAFNDFLEQTQWNGPIGEFAEEMVGGTLNALIIGDQELSKDDLFSKDNLIDTFLGVAIMGGVISGVKTLGYTTPETQYNRAIGDAKRGLEGHVSAEEMGLLEAFANNPFGTDYANLEPFFSKDRKKEDKEAVGRYLAAVAKKQGYEISRNAQLSGTQQGMQEMQKAFQLGQNMTEADLYDVNQAYAEAENDAFIQYIFNAGLDGTTAEELRNYSSYDLFRLSQSQDHNLSEDNRRVIRNLAIVKNAKEGLDSKLASMAQASISAHNLISTRSADKNGRITKGMVDGKIVYVKGDVKVENGSIVKPEGAAGYPVTIVDSMTGETMTVNSDEVGSVENFDVNEYNLDMADTINSAFNKRWSEWSETKSTKSKLNDVQNMVGAPIYLDVNGKLVEVEVNQILPNGEVLIKGKKGDLGGQSTIRVDVDSFYDSLARDEIGRPIYVNQDNFRSQTANINAAQPSSENYVKKTGAETSQAPVATEVAPTTEPTIEPTEPEIEDFNEMEVDILINGVPVRVEVTNQDDVSGRITYRYTDANGDVKIGGSTIADFRQAVADAKAYNDSQPVPQTDTNADVTTTETSTETAPEVTTDNTSTEDVNLTPQTINWDELFEQDQESYFLEMQKQFGDKTERRLKAIITATQKKLDALNNVELETDNDILENDEKREKLEAKIAALNGMVQRLSAPVQTPEVTEEAPEATVETEPVTDVAPETEPTAEEEVTTEEPVAEEEPVMETQPEPAPETDVTTEPVNETPAPVAPNPVPNPIAAAKDREAKLLELLNRNAVSDELKADAAKRAGKEVADMFATYEEYEAYEAEAADLGEFVDFFDEGVKESFATRNQQNNSGNSQGNSVSLEEPKTENNGEQTGQTEAPETAPRQDDNSTSGGTDNGGNEEVDTTGSTGEQTQRESESENDKAEPLAYDYPARKGNATGRLLINTFGFSNVTIPDSRKDILNTIYDFMMEMSKMLGISPKSIGQGGWLGVDNLRGNSSSSATYQFSNTYDGTVVNPRLKLKYARLSSIAHEWWHSLDHVLSFFEDGKGNVLTTHINKNFFKGRKETYDAVEAIKRAIKKSGHWFRMENLNVPRSYKNYLTKYEEMAARAFDTYINDKFAEAGIVVEGSVYNDNPYQPTAEEMAVIAPAFDNLFKVLKEKEGKTAGTSVLYHIGEQMKEGSEAWRLATNAVIKKLIDSGINVVKVSDQQLAEMIEKGDVQFLESPNGTVYGWTDGKNIYLTEAGMNPNTPVHEYTHLWARAMMQKNPKGWNSVKNLLKGTDIWNEVVNDPNYKSIQNDEDAVASEALSRVSGAKNAAKLEQMAQKMLDEAKGTMRKAEARGLIQNIKDALNQFWSWVSKNLFEIENFGSVEEVTDRVLWDLMNETDLGELSEGQVETQIVTDPKVIAELEASPKQAGYRNVVQNDDGTFSSPMAYWLQHTKQGAKSRVETDKFELGKWEEAKEHPELVDENGHVTLVKPNKKTVSPVAYDPYIHNRLEPVNLQFKEAWKRSDLVYVETEVAETDLNSGYHADKAKLPVGIHSWSNGAVMLSKYDKPVRVMSWNEVADAWAKRLNGEGVEFDVVPAPMRTLLIERGVDILPPHKNSGKDCEDAYKAWKNDSDSDALLFRKKMIKDFSDMTDEELYDFLDEYEGQYSSYSTDGNAYHNYLKEPNKDIIEAIKKSIISNGIDEVGRNVVFVGDYAYLVDHLKSSELAQDPNGIGIIRKVNVSGVENSAKHLIKESIYAGRVRNRRDVNKWIGAYRAKRELYNRYFGSVEDAEAALVDGRLDWRELRERLLSRNAGGVAQSWLSPKTGEKSSSNSADIQNAAVDYLVGEARNAAIENAVNEEASKLRVKVTYKTREQMPEGHENDKGYYNTKTGEIVVCTENASSIADAIQTILHESVAHKGLRQLMGDKFNEFINRVYNSLDAETKAKVDARAAAEYDGNTAVATEEYMATLAESENFADNSVWDKIKSIFEDIINAILGRNDIKIGDNELRYILRASYNNMVNPRGMETVRGWAQDQMMREKYKINQAETPEILSRTGIDPEKAARETASAVYDRVVNSKWNEFQRQFQDAYQPVRVAIDAIQQATGNIPIEDYENYLLMQNQSSSRSRVEIDNFERKYYTPIIEQVNAIIDRMLEARGAKKNDKNERAAAYAELRQYLIAKHGLERNEYYQNNKTRKLTYNEKKKAIKEATDEYNAIVDSINSDTSLSDAEIDSQLQEAKDAYDAALIEIETREVPDIRDYSGLTSLLGFEPKQFREAEAMAQKVVETFEGSVDTSELWKKINAATDKTLRHSYESGLLSRQQYSDIKSMFKFYIPLRGFDETTAEDVYSYARFEGNRFNPAVQTAKGRTSVADDPIAIIMNMAESEIAQGNKNRAKQALYNYLLNRAQGNEHQNSLMRVEDVWYVISTDEFGNTISSIAAPDHEHGETYEEFEDRMQALAEENLAAKSKKGGVDLGVRFQKQGNRNAHYVYLKVNGVEKAIYINGDPKAAEAINGSNRPEQTDAQKVMRDINRVVSSTFTNYSLEFTVRNYFRDMLYSHINMSIRESDPAYRVQFRKNWRNNNLGTMMKLLNAYRSGELDGVALSDTEAAFVEFMNNGGQTGYTLINSVEAHKKDLEKAIKRMQSGAANGGVKNSTIFKYTLGGIELLNEATELVTRFAAFKTSRDLGRGLNTSINDAKEITVNFNTKGAQDGKGVFGSIAKYFGWSKYFFNASVQGVQNIKAMAQANKLKFGTVVGGIAGLGFMMPIITAAIANIFSGDDDDDDNAYWNIPEYDRQNNICIPVGKTYVKLPLPIGFREIYAIGDMVASMMFDKKFTRDVSSVGMDMANKIVSVVLPVNPLESTANGLNIWHTFLYTALPSTLQFAVQNATNIDWKGAPLQKEYTYNEDDPQWMKAFAGNPDWMVCLSKWCNENINIDGDFEGMDWSPEKLDNTLSNLGGGIYTLIKKIGKTISMTWNEEERNLQNAPVVGVAIGSGIDSDDNFVNGSYFDMKDYYDANVNRIKRVAKSFGYEDEDVFIKKKGQHHPKMAEIYSNKNFEFMKQWYKGNEKLNEIKNDIKKLEKEINASGKPSASKQRRVDALNRKLVNQRREFVNKMLEME